MPKQILVPTMPGDSEAVLEYLARQRGGPVDLRVPVRGRSARSSAPWSPTRTTPSSVTGSIATPTTTAGPAALEALQRDLGLPDAPLRIECYDMSHLQGSDYVGSMVVFEDALPKKSDYRHYRVSAVDGNDDYAAMEEVLTRRLTSLLKEEAAAVDGSTPATRRRFAYPPQLLLLDGGMGQLNVGVRVLDALGLTDRIPIAALAKSFEEIYRPGDPEPIRLPRQSEALYLLQRVRDEAHRFAISHHRKLRGKRMTKGALDGVRGLGPKRRRRLLKEFGGLAGLRETSKEALVGLSWLPVEVGAAVYDRLHDPLSPDRPARTGAVVDR